MLDTAFARIKGDAGNPQSYPFATRIKTVAGAGALDVVRSGGPSEALVARFIAAAQELEAEGAVGIVSTCGFLVYFQARIAGAVGIPVMVSALSLYPVLRAAFGQVPMGILTASATSLSQGGLAAAAIPAADVAVAGMEGCAAFASAILAQKAQQSGGLDRAAIACFAVAAAQDLLRSRPDIGCFLLECGNLPPYSAAIATATGRPVFSILDGAALFWRGACAE